MAKKEKEIDSKSSKKNKKKEVVKKTEVDKKKKTTEKKSLWVRFRIFCNGVKGEFNKVHWPSKQDMLKYSIATIFFIIFCGAFFYIIDIIFAFIRSLF